MRRHMVLIRITFVLIFVTALFALSAAAAPVPFSNPRMRPYSGIGVLLVQIENRDDEKLSIPFALYEEPAVSRFGSRGLGDFPRHEWIFGKNNLVAPLFVMARKGEWVRIVFDDAGREAWLDMPDYSAFMPWEDFLKGRQIQMLPGLQKKYYQAFKRPGSATAYQIQRHAMKVIRVDGDWAMVISGLHSLYWVRWRDEDGRMLVAV